MTERHPGLLELLESFSKLLNTGDGSDFTLSSKNGQTWRLHRVIVCPRSEHFSRALNAGFKESNTQDIVIPEEPILVWMLIRYLYTLDYTTDNEADAKAYPTELEDLEIHAHLYVMADIYRISSLKLIALTKLETAYWQARILEKRKHGRLSDMHIQRFLSLVGYIYENTPTMIPSTTENFDLRGLVCRLLLHYATDFEQFSQQGRFKELVSSDPDFALDNIRFQSLTNSAVHLTKTTMLNFVKQSLRKPVNRPRKRELVSIAMGPLDNYEQLHPEVEELVKRNLELFESGKYSDFIVRCGSYEWKLHSQIVCPRSNFFDRCLYSDFKVAILPFLCLSFICYPKLCKQESSTRVIDLKDENPELVHLMVKYFYALHYSIPDGSPLNEIVSPFIHAEMYFMADKFGINALKAAALANFRLLFPPFHDCYNAGSKAKWFSITSQLTESMLQLIPYVYENTVSVEDPLKEAMVMELCQDLEDWYMQDGFRSLLIQIPQFGADIIKCSLELKTEWREDLQRREWRAIFGDFAVDTIPGIGEPSDWSSDEGPAPIWRWGGEDEKEELRMAQRGLEYHHLNKSWRWRNE
ncbi:MAG: hypothetical protein Q9167_006607 [Letrouitia subvulpina]